MGVLNVLAVADPAVQVYVNDSSILKGFNHPVNFSVVPWAEYYPRMMKAFKGEEYYDIVMIAGHLWKAQFASKGYLATLDAPNNDILPTIRKEMQYKNKYYLSPSFCDGHMVVFKKSVMDKLKIKVGDVLSAKDYYETAKSLNKNGYKIAMKAHPSEIFTDALPFLRAYGGDIYDSDGVFSGDESQVVKGLELYRSLKEFAAKDTYTYGNEEIITAFNRSNVAMCITWSGQIGFLMNSVQDKEDIGFATLETAWNVTWSFGILNTCKEKEIAKEFLKYLVSPEVDYKVGCACGAPIRKSSYIKGMEIYPHFKPQLQMIEKYAKLLPDMEDAGDKNEVLYKEIYKAFLGETTCKECMEFCNKKITTLQII